MAVRKTKAGTFEVDFRDQQGKKRLKTFDTKREAVAYEKDVLAQVSKGEYLPPSSKTVKEIAETWLGRKLDAKNYKRSSLETWKNHINGFINVELGAFPASRIDGNVEAIETATLAWTARVSPATAKKIRTTLTAVLDLAVRYKFIKQNPTRQAERVKLQTADEDAIEVRPEEVYTKSEVRRLLEATEPQTAERVLLMALAFLGLRIGEARALKWQHVDLKGGKLQVALNLADQGKGNPPLFTSPKTKSSERTLSLPAELVREMTVWKLKCPISEHDLVFATVEGKPYTRTGVSRILDRAIKTAKLEKRLTPHGLRHSFASLLLADRIPAPEVAAYLGHKNAGVTLRIYAHFVREETQAVHNLAASILGG
jgi:integrase